ncbi:hypothetical protein [Halorientalis pallida]|uniref:Uncharacterized protein n=1 Tax=Halorientalis pallida TaxID=2479928 RepID=A0A498KTF3_9EURY|nr:hypothetical protein [Halorientalis pallida]RXK47936.1 hypothetical protein EAF64_14975 [Halorientalis pallida]
MFDTVSISVTPVSEIDVVALPGVQQPCHVTDEKHAVLDGVFSAKTGREHRWDRWITTVQTSKVVNRFVD